MRKQCATLSAVRSNVLKCMRVHVRIWAFCTQIRARSEFGSSSRTVRADFHLVDESGMRMSNTRLRNCTAEACNRGHGEAFLNAALRVCVCVLV